MYDDEAIYVTQNSLKILKEILKENNSYLLTPYILFLTLAKQHKFYIAYIIFCFAMFFICRLILSIMFLELFNRVSDISTGTNLRDAYIIAVFCGLLLLLA